MFFIQRVELLVIQCLPSNKHRLHIEPDPHSSSHTQINHIPNQCHLNCSALTDNNPVISHTCRLFCGVIFCISILMTVNRFIGWICEDDVKQNTLTMACSILLSMATTLAPEELREKQNKTRLHPISPFIRIMSHNICMNAHQRDASAVNRNRNDPSEAREGFPGAAIGYYITFTCYQD